MRLCEIDGKRADARNRTEDRLITNQPALNIPRKRLESHILAGFVESPVWLSFRTVSHTPNPKKWQFRIRTDCSQPSRIGRPTSGLLRSRLIQFHSWRQFALLSQPSQLPCPRSFALITRSRWTGCLSKDQFGTPYIVPFPAFRTVKIALVPILWLATTRAVEPLQSVALPEVLCLDHPFSMIWVAWTALTSSWDWGLSPIPAQPAV